MPCYESPVIKQIDDNLRTNMSSLFNMEFSDVSWKQATLPISIGGFGIRQAHSLTLPCYLSSMNACKNLSTSIINDYILPEVYHEYENAWCVTSQNEVPKDPGYQKKWDQPLCQKAYELVEGEMEQYGRARLQAISNKIASAWLNCLPSSKTGTLLTNTELRVAFNIRLGHKQYAEHRCKCGEMVDTHGAHSFSCRKNSGKSIRHYLLNTVIHRGLTSAGIPNVVEPTGLLPSPS